ncbi:acetate--CoA ligase family protein [bacterium]|nr:acetate--CoA ligase family protein [bacterium]
METHVDFAGIRQLFENAVKEQRDALYEFEVYDLIRFVGSETPPRWVFLPKEDRLKPDLLDSIPGDKLVVKVVSPNILHKSDVDGVRIAAKDNQQLLSTIRRMKVEIPEKFAGLIERDPMHAPDAYRGLTGDDLKKAIADDIKGVILVQFMPPDSQEFGNELLVSLRWTREFGMILNAGLGGTDTELYASRFRKGQAVVAASTAMVNGETFFNTFKQTISYKKLAGLTRGQKRIVTDEQLLECFSALIATGNYFSPLNDKAPFYIDELEINPFAFSNYLMLPLDGLCRFSPSRRQIEPRPIDKIDKLLHPESIGIVGVSGKGANIGRIILDNILANGFDPASLTVVHPEIKQIGSVGAVASLRHLPGKLDLLILAVGAPMIPALMDEILDNDLAESVLLIPGGMGEKEGQEHVTVELQEKIRASRRKDGRGTVFLGGNSLGVLSNPGHYDAMFIPESKLPKTRGDHPRSIALISQSGAYMITRMSKLSFLDPAYALSIGNQIDLTASDILRYLNGIDSIKTIAFYMEGFNDQDGLVFAQAVREAVPKGKEIIFYKAGRTPEGKSATSGHTASIAGDYMVCESCISQAGAIVAENFTVFEGLLRLSNAFHGKTITGNRLAAISNAGYESVGIADNILGEDYQLTMSSLEARTKEKLLAIVTAGRLESLINVNNPLDITPMATEDVYEASIKALLEDDRVDAVVAAIVPLTPILHTLQNESNHDAFPSEQNLIQRIPRLAAESEKPLVIVVDSGPLYDPLANALQDAGLPVFRSADRAVTVLGMYIHGRLKTAELMQLI